MENHGILKYRDFHIYTTPAINNDRSLKLLFQIGILDVRKLKILLE